MEALPRNFDNQAWITVVFLISLVLIVWVKKRHEEKFYYFTRILTSDKFFIESRKHLRGFEGFNYGLFLPRALFICLGIYFIVHNLGLSQEVGMILFLKVFLLYFVFVVGKFLIERILGVLFSIEKILGRYSFFKETTKNFLGLILLPLLLLINYYWEGSSTFYKIILGGYLLINILFLTSYYRKNRKLISSSLFYFILYLCTFEIAPYFILYKAIN